MRIDLLVATAALAAVLPVRADAQSAVERMQPLLPQVTAWRRDIHEHPELGNREVRTARLVADQLERLGLEVRTGIAHTGVAGVLKGSKAGRRLVIRADMDALPVTEEVDLPFPSKSTAMLLGVASAMATMRGDLAGEVMFVFQPAEEGAPPGEQGGAPLMIAEGVFKDFRPDALLGMHVVSTLPVGTVALRPGGAMASSDTFRITVHGRQSHGATPWLGIDPIVAAAQIVTHAQVIVSRQLDINANPAVVTFGVFDGGQRFNIVPDSARLEGTVRAFDEEMRVQALASLRNVAEHVAAANGATIEAEIPVTPGSNPVNYNDPALTARVRASLETALGKDQVQEAPRWTAAEDFPHLGRSVSAPSVYFFVGATPAGRDPASVPGNHSPRFFVDEGALAAGSAGMLQAALDFLGTASDD